MSGLKKIVEDGFESIVQRMKETNNHRREDVSKRFKKRNAILNEQNSLLRVRNDIALKQLKVSPLYPTLAEAIKDKDKAKANRLVAIKSLTAARNKVAHSVDVEALMSKKIKERNRLNIKRITNVNTRTIDKLQHKSKRQTRVH